MAVVRLDTVDTYYTPSSVAKTLIQAGRRLRPKLVADLAAGRGDLLLAAERVWPTATYVATDIDRVALRRLARVRPTWIVGQCDLRNPRSRASSRALKAVRGSACLILLNPPFSCRGGTRFLAETSDGSIYASTAMSFLLLATKYVAVRGHIISLLPLGCVTNSKDEQAWRYLRSKYDVSLLGSRERGAFPGSAASTVLVRLSPHALSPTVQSDPQPLIPEPKIRVRVLRGSCAIHRLRREEMAPLLVHYTDIRNGSVQLNGRHGWGPHRCVDGPAILIPRVGLITVDKVAVLDAELPVMLSDCVIALKPSSAKDVYPLRDRMIEHFSLLRTHYVGTGAPFITLARLRTALYTMGVEVEQPS